MGRRFEPFRAHQVSIICVDGKKLYSTQLGRILSPLRFILKTLYLSFDEHHPIFRMNFSKPDLNIYEEGSMATLKVAAKPSAAKMIVAQVSKPGGAFEIVEREIPDTDAG